MGRRVISAVTIAAALFGVVAAPAFAQNSESTAAAPPVRSDHRSAGNHPLPLIHGQAAPEHIFGTQPSIKSLRVSCATEPFHTSSRAP
jgi:hypothetical protein